MAAGVVGVGLLVAGFAVNPGPSPAESASRLLSYAAANHGAILIGGWLQVTGTVVLAVFALGVAGLGGFLGRVSGAVLVVGLCTLLAVSLSEMACYVGLTSGHGATVLVAADLIPGVQHGYSIVAAPLVFMAIGFGGLQSASLPRALSIAALLFGVTFWVLGLVGVIFSIQPVVDFFSGFQALWWLAAAVIVGLKGVGPARGAKAGGPPSPAEPPAPSAAS